MILSNTAILEAMDRGALTIEPLAGRDPSASPFNTSAVDLRLGTEILVPIADQPLALDLRKPGISSFLHQHSRKCTISEDQPFKLQAAGWDIEPHSIAEQRTFTDGRIIPLKDGRAKRRPA
jgi:dCTP deaminase